MTHTRCHRDRGPGTRIAPDDSCDPAFDRPVAGHPGDGDGHPDFGWGLAVTVNGYVRQAMFCDPVAAPTSTSGGVLNPSGGMFISVSG